MKHIFVNLKRFEIPRSRGGICDSPDPEQWIYEVILKTCTLGLGMIPDLSLVFLLPESLLITARNAIQSQRPERTKHLAIGCQSVFAEDISPHKNFGAFTASRPATAMSVIGCTWTMIGHSEERTAMAELIGYGAEKNEAEHKEQAEHMAAIFRSEVRCAIEAGMNVLFNIGETAKDNGENDFASLRGTLGQQVLLALQDISPYASSQKIIIGYEPRWAIGPGKIPPDRNYIYNASQIIRELCKDAFGREIEVVYGGGLKRANAAEIASLPTIGGGLIGLTNFTEPIGFYPEELRNIINEYQSG